MRDAVSHGTADENDSEKRRSGTQAAFAFSRSHHRRAVKGGRTSYSKTCSFSVAMPVAVAMPAPHESVSCAPGAKRWRASSTSEARVVGLPVEAREDRVAVGAFDAAQADRVGQSRDAHDGVRFDRFACRGGVELQREALVLVDAARPRRVLEHRGAAGRERELALAVDRRACERARVAATSVKRQRTPAGRSSAKLKTHVYASAQRALPFAEQSIANGSAALRGSPSGTIGSEKRALA